MELHATSKASALLARVRDGDRTALGQLFPLVYDALRRVARSQRRGRLNERTLNTTAVVHEVFIRLMGQEVLELRDRDHFMAVAAMAMRQIVIDHARRKAAQKRGCNPVVVPFHEIEAALAGGPDFGPDRAVALLAVDSTLTRLAARSDRWCRIAECRLFGGLSIEETAAAVGVSVATAKRDWALARAWLHREMREDAR